MKYIEQLALWVDGKPTHDTEHDTCCPDFSCCQPHLLAPAEVRQVFAAAYAKGDERVTMRLLMEFLGRAFSGKQVYIAGLDTLREECLEEHK